MDFNPRSRVGSDNAAALVTAGTSISIHAPAWGATSGGAKGYDISVISIHAPAWGATAHDMRLRQSKNISIHAPAWGATRIWVWTRPLRNDFNPRSRVGSDAPFWHSIHSIFPFQSTLPRGERLYSPIIIVSSHYNFNPRSRVGSDSTNIEPS